MKKSFSDIFEDQTRLAVKIPQSAYLHSGKYIIVDQGQKDIAGYSDNSEGLFTDIPAIVFGDHTRIIKYVDEPFFIGADGVKVLKSTIKNADCKYLFYALKNVKIPNTGYNRHFKWLKDSYIEIPNLQVQKQIAMRLDKIQELVSLQNEQIRKLEQLVKSRFMEMFGDPITNPKGWSVKKVIDVITLQRGYDLPVQDRNTNGNIPVYGSNGIVGKHDTSKLDFGIITGRSGTLGIVYCSHKPFWPLNTTLFSSDTHGNNIVYLKYLLTFYNLKRFSAGTGVPTLNRNVFHDTKIIDVPLSLQKQFAEFVERTETQKALLEKRLNRLETLYKSLMQQYFG